MYRQHKALGRLMSVAVVACLASTVLAGPKRKMDIVDTSAKADNFQTLVTAVKAAGLVQTLKGDGPFTVFAPTDAAFAKLPKGTIENLLKPENRELLASILTYHVVPGRVMAADVVKLSHAKTVNGQRIAIKVTDGGVMALAKDDMSLASRSRMTALMRAAEQTHDASRRAWMLRHALDTAYASLDR